MSSGLEGLTLKTSAESQAEEQVEDFALLPFVQFGDGKCLDVKNETCSRASQLFHVMSSAYQKAPKIDTFHTEIISALRGVLSYT